MSDSHPKGKRPRESTSRRKLPERLSREEAVLLLKQPNARYPTGARNRALLRILYRGGLRCEEALALTPRSVNMTRREIRVDNGKGGKDRVVPTDEATLEILDRWKAVRPRSDWLFCTLDGDRMDSGYVRKMVARYGVKAGIEIRCHPHLLRHTCASELLEEGFTLVEVQAVLGHERLETTAIYQHVANTRLRSLMVNRPG